MQIKITSPKIRKKYIIKVLFIDKWWFDKKNKLKQKLIKMNLDKETFLKLSIDKIENDYLKQLIIDTDDSKQQQQNDYQYDFNEIIINIRLCIDNWIQNKSITFCEWIINLLEDEQEFQNKLSNVKKYIFGSKITGLAVYEIYKSVKIEII